MALRYKFVELSVVTDEAIERTVNDWVGRGWQLDGIRFVVTEHSRRPAMAFVSFVRNVGPGEAGGASQAGEGAGAAPGTAPHVIADDNEVE